jgi:hypothetical protein
MYRRLAYSVVTAGLAFAIIAGPARADVVVVQDSGGANPNNLGFSGFSGPVPGQTMGNAWVIPSGAWNVNYALYNLTAAQVTSLNAAPTWTLTATFSNLSTNTIATFPGAPDSCGSYASVSFNGIRFDLGIRSDGAGNQILSLDPFTGGPQYTIQGLGTSPVTLSLIYNNGSHTADAYVNGVDVIQGYAGGNRFTGSAVFFGGESGAFSNVELSYSTGPSFIGSMPHIAAEENWTTTFTLVNKSSAASLAFLTFFGDAADPTGNGPLTLPLTFPQEVPPASTQTSSFTQSITANGLLIVQTAGPPVPPVLVGSAQLADLGAVDGFAIFHLIPGAQEAVVPMETRDAASYVLAFDNTGGVVLGVAVANVSAQAGTVGVILRDDTGTQIGTGSIAMQPNGHKSFDLSDPATGFPVTANKRGTIEFDTPAGGQISVLGIRTTPLGTSNTLTTIPALANVGTTGGSIAHIATGNGWQTTFVLVNTGTTAASVSLNFYADVTGTALTLPISFPQTGTTVSNASTVSQMLAAGASLYVQSDAPVSNPTPTTGSAQLTTSGNVSGFVIFRYNPNGQEAVVPLESRTASGFILAFDNTSGTSTGIAVNSVSTASVNVPVIVRDDAGNQLTTDTLSLAANGHLAFTLGSSQTGYMYPQTANIRGTIEFDTPGSAQIGALGIRIPLAHTFTSLPALAK